MVEKSALHPHGLIQEFSLRFPVMPANPASKRVRLIEDFVFFIHDHELGSGSGPGSSSGILHNVYPGFGLIEQQVVLFLPADALIDKIASPGQHIEPLGGIAGKAGVKTF